MVPPAGGVPLGLVLGGGGGGVCSGAPPGCELGALAGGAIWPLDGGVLGVVVSLGVLADPPEFDGCEQAPTASVNAATHSNNRLRFMGSPLKGSFQTEAQRRKRRSSLAVRAAAQAPLAQALAPSRQENRSPADARGHRGPPERRLLVSGDSPGRPRGLGARLLCGMPGTRQPRQSPSPSPDPGATMGWRHSTARHSRHRGPDIKLRHGFCPRRRV